MKDKLLRWLKGLFWQYKLKYDLNKNSVLKTVDFKEGRLDSPKSLSTNEKPSIAFIAPPIFKGSGGFTSLLRIGTFFAESGHRVFYISYVPIDDNSIKNAEFNYNFKGRIYGPEAMNSIEADIGIATLWPSAYYLWNMPQIFYRAYFVQDYEPYFYAEGPMRAFAENTYKLGYHMISLGGWNKKQIEKNLDVAVDEIVFPYDPLEYSVQADWKNKFKRQSNLVKICAYVKHDDRRGAVFALMALEELYKALLKRDIKLQITLFGEEKSFRYPISAPYKHAGKLSKTELKKLYNESDFGVVFSYTNISFVSLEMMACGCPIVEVSEGSFKDFFDPNCAILVNSFPREFINTMLYYIEHPELCLQKAELALTKLDKHTWQEAISQFHDLLLSKFRTAQK